MNRGTTNLGELTRQSPENPTFGCCTAHNRSFSSPDCPFSAPPVMTKDRKDLGMQRPQGGLCGRGAWPAPL